jgi:hypothetical protein
MFRLSSRSSSRILMLLGTAVAVACSDAVAPEDIAGTWNATSLVFTSTADPSETFDAVAAGVELSITFGSGGAVSLTVTEGAFTETETGTYTLDGSLTLDGEVSSGSVNLSGSTLTLTLTSGVEFDFDDDGTDEPARLVAVLTKE